MHLETKVLETKVPKLNHQLRCKLKYLKVWSVIKWLFEAIFYRIIDAVKNVRNNADRNNADRSKRVNPTHNQDGQHSVNHQENKQNNSKLIINLQIILFTLKLILKSFFKTDFKQHVIKLFSQEE